MKTAFGGDRWWWPVCPEHGTVYTVVVDGWIYCVNQGWHVLAAVKPEDRVNND